LLYPYPPQDKFLYLFLVFIIASLALACIYYLGWHIAENILLRTGIFKDRLFALVFIAGLITASIIYPLEALGINSGWWSWKISEASVGRFLPGCPLHPVREGFYLAVYFLAAYFLIECSKYRKSSWKMIFFILPFIHVWTLRLFGTGFPRFLERSILSAILIILAYLSPLRIEYDKPRRQDANIILDKALTVFLILAFLIICFAYVMVIRNPSLTISLLPISFFLLLSIRKIPAYLVAIIALVFFILTGMRHVFLLIPVFAVASFMTINYGRNKYSYLKR